MSTEEQITEQHSTKKQRVRTLVGQVVSTNMEKSVAVVVERLVQHRFTVNTFAVVINC